MLSNGTPLVMRDDLVSVNPDSSVSGRDPAVSVWLLNARPRSLGPSYACAPGSQTDRARPYWCGIEKLAIMSPASTKMPSD